MKHAALLTVAFAVAGLVPWTTDAYAFRMIQNTNAIRTSTAFRVTCDDPVGFTHRTMSTIGWRINPAGQGGKPGVLTAVQNAIGTWNQVPGSGYAMGYEGTTGAGFATDGLNTALWSLGNGCTGGCLAITALVLGPGQQILEADISFNDAVTWGTGGSDYDVQAIASHELGHSMGIHHTEITRKRNRPTMYASYFGTDGRTLEDDDRAALACAYDRYPPLSSATLAVADDRFPAALDRSAVRLVSRPGAGGTTLRFAMDAAGPVRLEVFDLAGRRMTTLLNDVRGAGEHELVWDGRLASERARPGIYFARLVTPRGEGRATIFLQRASDTW